MSTYVVGDVHGCLDELQALLRHIDHRPDRDRLVLTGDLVNRGPDSLSVLRWAWANNVDMVLGNHDLHLLARVQGINPPLPGDRLDELLAAADLDILLDWLRSRPLLIDLGSHWVVHAGLHPEWTPEQTLYLASTAAERLRADPGFLAAVVAESRDDTTFAQLTGDDALAQAARILCMVRGCRAERHPVMMMPPPGAPESSVLVPWFRCGPPPARPVCFGHDAAFGARREGNAVCVDSGCGYGGPLSAFWLEGGRWFRSRPDTKRWRWTQ